MADKKPWWAGPNTPEWMLSAGPLAAGFVPGVGEAMDASDAYDAWKKGNYGEAALATAGMGLGVVPVVGDAAATGLRTARRGLKARDIAGAKRAHAVGDLKQAARHNVKPGDQKAAEDYLLASEGPLSGKISRRKDIGGNERQIRQFVDEDGNIKYYIQTPEGKIVTTMAGDLPIENKQLKMIADSPRNWRQGKRVMDTGPGEFRDLNVPAPGVLTPAGKDLQYAKALGDRGATPQQISKEMGISLEEARKLMAETAQGFEGGGRVNNVWGDDIGYAAHTSGREARSRGLSRDQFRGILDRNLSDGRIDRYGYDSAMEDYTKSAPLGGKTTSSKEDSGWSWTGWNPLKAIAGTVINESTMARPEATKKSIKRAEKIIDAKKKAGPKPQRYTRNKRGEYIDMGHSAYLEALKEWEANVKAFGG